MGKKEKMNFKPFFEEISKVLDQSDINDLKNIIKTMAEKVPPLDRASFAEQVSCYRKRSDEKKHIDDDLLNRIDGLKQEIEQVANDPDNDYYDHEYYYDDYRDEDSLGPFEEYVTELANLFDEVATVFDYDNFQLAYDVYEKLFTILKIEDEHGRGICDSDLENIDLEETRARYLRSVYLTAQPDKRVEVIIEKMSEMEDFGSSRPTIKEFIDISIKPLPDFKKFIKELISFLTNQNGDKFDSWLREAVKIDGGVVGLERLAKSSGTVHPRACYDWIAALIADDRFEDAVCAAKYALDKLPEKPIKAAIADLLTCAADKIGGNISAQEGRWLSFVAKPTLTRLILLSRYTDNGGLSLIMQDSAKVIKRFLDKRDSLSRNSWEKDDIDDESYVAKTLLLHSHLLGQDFESAFQLAKNDHPLGWSSDNCQPFFVACIFILASGKALSKAPERLKTFWRYAANSTLSYCYDCDADKIVNDLTVLYEKILTQNESNNIDGYFSWCIGIARKRINEIVGNTHRGAYEKAAILTAVCVELFKCRNEPERATDFYGVVKHGFPRHSSFQRELKKIFNK